MSYNVSTLLLAPSHVSIHSACICAAKHMTVCCFKDLEMVDILGHTYNIMVISTSIWNFLASRTLRNPPKYAPGNKIVEENLSAQWSENYSANQLCVPYTCDDWRTTRPGSLFSKSGALALLLILMYPINVNWPG